MRVWILETGVYEDRGVSGVFSSVDAAKKDWEDDHPNLDPGWALRGERWVNAHDWDLHARAIPYEVEGIPDPDSSK